MITDALTDMLRAIRVMMAVGGRSVGSLAPAPYYVRRARERLAEARRTAELDRS